MKQRFHKSILAKILVLTTSMVSTHFEAAGAARNSAPIPPVCRQGSLPARYQGVYADTTTENRSPVRLTSNQMIFESQNRSYSLNSCVYQGYRLVSLVNPQYPAESFNSVVLTSLESGHLQLMPINFTPSPQWPNRISDLLKDPRDPQKLWVLEKVSGRVFRAR